MRRRAEFSIAAKAGSLDRYGNRRAESMSGMTARQSSPIAVPIQLTDGNCGGNTASDHLSILQIESRAP
jgi:hypothetical protein